MSTRKPRVELVSHCSQCDLMHWNEQEHWCQLDEDVRPLSGSRSPWEPIPDWCPLRSQPVLFKLEAR
jgi:hypothetical protein